MPKGDPDSLGAEDSAAVAAFIYDAFYSPTAQFRNQPARVELSRLTGRQYRHALADVIVSFTGAGDWNDERGLKGEYFTSRHPRGDSRRIERIDPVVDFHFGDKTPDPEMIPSAEEFSAEWEGAVIAPDDGDYEFLVETENGMRLWVNDPETPLIDAEVKSGDGTEFRASIPLLGGRAYRLKLRMIKSKPEKSCSMVLKWKRPGHAMEVIPQRSLWPQQPPERLVVSTPFPPDDRSTGYERGTSISKEWNEATTYAALEAATWIAERADRLAGTKSDAGDRKDKLKAFAGRFVERAFRRPLTDDEKQVHIDRQFAESPDDDIALRRVVLLALKSPRFLYPDLFDESSKPYAVASRLSFALWDSIPDEPLLSAAANGQLQTREQAQGQVDRMLADHRTFAKLNEFFRQWLRIDHFSDLAKDQEKYPDFTPEVISDLRTSLELELNDIVASDNPDLRRLFTTEDIFLNGRLAKFYGVDLPENADFQKVSAADQHRVGIMSHPYLLAGFSYRDTTSPIHRGVFLTRNIFGRVLRPPPVAVAPLAPDLHEDLTTRERVILQTSPEACQSCHTMINPLGFSLEHFDAVGRYRQTEKEKPIDSTGTYVTKSGDVASFADVADLAAFLSTNSEAPEAFVTQIFHYTVKQPVMAYGLDRPRQLQDRFLEQGCNIRKLLGECAVTAAMDVPAPAGEKLSRDP
jgi:hypothetical protein